MIFIIFLEIFTFNKYIKRYFNVQYRPFTTSIFRTHFERSNNNFF
jgi:hypothetical protein